MGRSPCCEKAHTNKGAWSKQEDETLIAYIQAHGEGCWRTLPKNAGLQRCGKSCRLRWINYLRPDLKRGNFTLEEDELIIKLHSILGNKWSLIAGKLPGRTDNEIKNYWNTHIKKKLLERGVDPYTHRPITRSASDSSSSNDTNCHVPMATSAETATTSFTDFFQQQHTVSHFLFPSSSSTSAGADQEVVNSSYHADNGDNENHNSYDLNLDLSITLPYSSMEKGTISVVENNFGSEADTKQKSHVCFHIGLSCSSCSG